MTPTNDDEYISVCQESELPPGERLFIDLDGTSIVILNLNGDIYAFGDVCTHDDGPVGEGDIEGQAIICPRHGAKFDMISGEALSLPAVMGIPAYKTRTENNMIQISLLRRNQ